MELIIVKTADVVPDENNPREDFSGTEELAESFYLNRERPGEPFQPPLLVRDGEIFKIYDGERRYRAIKHNNLETFAANVCDNYEEADAMIAQLATNDKRQLTEIEESRAVQRSLMLGIKPEQVEKAARMKRGSASMVASAMKRVGDVGNEMTLDRMFAVAEFIDDDEAVDKLMKCDESEWAAEAARIRSQKLREQRAAEIQAKAKELGIELLTDGDASGRKGYKYDYRLTARSATDLEKAHGEAPDALFSLSADGCTVFVYTPKADEPERSPEEIEEEKRAGELAEAFEAAICDLNEWFVAMNKPKRPKPMPNVLEHVMKGFADAINLDNLTGRYPELTEDKRMSKIDMAYGFSKTFPHTTFSLDKAKKVMKRVEDWETRSIPHMAEVFAAAVMDGFTWNEQTEPAKAALEAFLADDGDDEE